eukprot:CAMPEP_0118951832 /NCGR_PEP_ID=MMETSP1169-20130426/53787_1 /TAXON_ID=36882 /ORGANISM="Pyramimonas obovata, Strain CCMP722" /LENGTH=542 /DNA_ID=CAMNT_0006898969 /DNA_START=1001 /DNA_END=2630 /DNA_ORIENTATION=+
MRRTGEAQTDTQHATVTGALVNRGHDVGRSYRKGLGVRAILQLGEDEGQAQDAEAQEGETATNQEEGQLERPVVEQSQITGGAVEDQVWNSTTVRQAQVNKPATPQKKPQPHLQTVKVPSKLPHIVADYPLKNFEMKPSDPVLIHLKRYEKQYEEHAAMWKAVGEEEYLDWKYRPNTQALKAQIDKLKAIRKKHSDRDYALKNKLIRMQNKVRDKPLKFTPGQMQLARKVTTLPGFALDPQIRENFESKVLAEKGGAETLATMRNGRCAVVGNSGHLRLTRFGPSIDQHDFVVRINAAPIVAHAEYVGTKTSVRMLNTGLSRKIEDLVTSGKPLETLVENGTALWIKGDVEEADALRRAIASQQNYHQVVHLDNDMAYAPVPLFRQVYLEMLVHLQAAAQAAGDEEELRRFTLIRDRMRHIRKVANHSATQGSFRHEGNGDDLFGKPSTGIMAVYLLKDICKSLTVYGIGTHNAIGEPVGYKYYTPEGVGGHMLVANKVSGVVGSTAHSFEFELELFSVLAKDGAIKFCIYDPTNTTSNTEC